VVGSAATELRGGVPLARIDYYDAPEAPAAYSLVPSANVVVVNDEGALLVIHRSDNDSWAFPGGAMDLGEPLVTAAVREVTEETGIDCQIAGLVGICTDPKQLPGTGGHFTGQCGWDAFHIGC
jgi:8-oxo-dGTP pyrophosphatase MutT (NUDIX family)